MTKHTLEFVLLPLALVASPARAQVPQVVVAPDIDVVIAPDVDAPVNQDINVTVAPVVNVVVMSPPPVALPAVPPPVAVIPVPAAPPPPPVPTTELHFASGDDDEYVISVYREEPTWDYEPLCVTPCTLDIENGMYDFMAGGHRTFRVYAIGGVQYWSVEDNNMAGIVAGSVLTGLGGLTTLVGGIMSGAESDSSYDSYDSYDSYGTGSDDVNPGYAVLGVGAGVGALGLVIWLCSYGFAEQTSQTEGFIPVADGVGILPTVYSNQGTSGDREWGLGVGVRF
jgi:hypothetical protein